MPLRKAKVASSQIVTPPSTGDPLFSSVSLLLPLREDFNDRSTYARSPSNSGVSLSSNQAKFGSQSAKFENFGHLDFQGNFDLPSDFTFEVWIYQVNRPTSISSIFETYSNGSGYSFAISNGSLVMFDGSTAFTGLSQIPLNQWCYLAAMRKGQILSLWLDGVPDLVVINSKPLSTAGSLRVGTNLSNPPNFQQNAYYQDFRITKAARAIILPTQPLPTA